MTTEVALLAAIGLHCRYGDRPVLHDINTTIHASELVGLIGPNGAGKSSLLKALAGLLAPSKGCVRLHQRELGQYKKIELARQLSYLAQGASVQWPLLAQRVVELGRLPHTGFGNGFGHDLSPTDRDAVTTAMAQADVTAFAGRTITALSEGERMRVMIARMFATQAPLMLADEPMAWLDWYHQHHTLELFQQHCQRGGSAVVVLHDLNLAARFCDKLVLLDQGRIVRSGSPQQVLDAEVLRTVYRMELEVQLLDGVVQVLPRWRHAELPTDC